MKKSVLATFIQLSVLISGDVLAALINPTISAFRRVRDVNE
ncbi:MAG: hypothetical protein ACI9CO_002085 [Candidatus Azotimanducaceae bacterium]|jgi:hypothetical protein